MGAVDGKTSSDRGDSVKFGGGSLNMCGPAGICGSTLSGASGTLYAELAAAAVAPAPGG